MLDTVVKPMNPRVWFAAFFPSAHSRLRFHHSEFTGAGQYSTHLRFTQMSSLGNTDHELMTPELLQTISSQESDCLDPVQVHLLWIGDLDKAPKETVQYSQHGYNLTVHTSVDEVLDGFQPFVRKAYDLAIPTVVGYDFLKLLLLFKYGGFVVDADTTPQIEAGSIELPVDCSVLFGKEAHMPKEWFTTPQYRDVGGPSYPLVRPYQLLNWAMAASTPRNVHIGRLVDMCMMRFFGLRDVEYKLIQDIAGSGLMSDYYAMLYERAGKSFPEAFDNPAIVPVDGACMADELFTGKWIFHHYLGSWKARPQQDEVVAEVETVVVVSEAAV